MMQQAEIKAIAEQLDHAALNRQPITQWATQGISLSSAQAYAIQREVVAQRVARGNTLLGVKMGFTSRAKMLQMGVSDMILGALTSDMLIEDGAVFNAAGLIHPRVEPEIAFLLKKPLSGDFGLSEVISAVEAVAPALEVIDSRYQNFKFSLADVIADNCSSAGFCLGSWQKPTADLANLGMVMSVNGAAVQIGSSAAILGNPYRSLVAAARLAVAAGTSLLPGSIVLAGAASAAEALIPNSHVRLSTELLGNVEFTVTTDVEQR